MEASWTINITSLTSTTRPLKTHWCQEFDTDEKAVTWFEKTKKAKLAQKGWGERDE